MHRYPPLVHRCSPLMWRYLSLVYLDLSLVYLDLSLMYRRLSSVNQFLSSAYRCPSPRRYPLMRWRLFLRRLPMSRPWLTHRWTTATPSDP